jgi:hypothetical protein
MQNNQPITPGTRYRDVQATVFPEWIVEEVYMAPAGIEHAGLVSATKPAERTTLSVATLRDRRRFARVDR